MVSVTIGGQQPEAVMDVEDTSEVDSLGSATIVVGDTAFNRSTFSSGDEVVIDRASGTWTGYLTGDPKSGDGGTIDLEAMDKRYELKNSNTSRPFFERDSGEIVRQVVLTRSEDRGREDIHRGSDLTGWSSDLDEFELGNLATKKLHEKGSDVIFGGIREGESGTFYARFDDVSARAVPGRAHIYKLETRLWVNDGADQITVEIELVSENGVPMVWEVNPSSSGFTTYELNLEDAEPGEIADPLTLEYRFNISGNLADNTGIAIDYATTYTFEVKNRDTSLDPSGIRDTGRTITRRWDQSALEVIQDLEVEDNFQSWVDENEVVHFEPAGGQSAGLQIVQGETAVVDADFDRDYDGVTNEVKVQGDGVQVNVRDSESIRYYGLSPRDEPLVDQSIKTESEAKDRGDGYLQKNAWDEVAATFTIADSSYGEVPKGSSIFVSWPSADLQGEFVVNQKKVRSSGYVELGVGVRT